jgi:hypothetical protein
MVWSAISLGEILAQVTHLQGSQTRYAEGVLEYHVIPGVGQHKIELVLLDMRAHAFEAQWHYLELVFGHARTQIIGSRGPALDRILLAAKREHANCQFRLSM